jgi:Glycine/D-amino acid oxidases (deaminating)
LALHFPHEEIILVEAQEVGFGTSGRNAGFAIDLPHDIGAEDYIGDIATAKTSLKLNLMGQDLLKELVLEHGIDCQMKVCGKYQAAVEDRGIAVLEAYRRGLDKLGQDYRMIEAGELPEHIGTHFYRKALFTPGTVLIQPAALVKRPGRFAAGQRHALRKHADHRSRLRRAGRAAPRPGQHQRAAPATDQQRLRHEFSASSRGACCRCSPTPA